MEALRVITLQYAALHCDTLQYIALHYAAYMNNVSA